MAVKPATATHYSALAMAELAGRAGVPTGVLAVVTGSAGDVGGELSTNQLVRKLTFTGLTEIGKKLMEQCSGTVKKTSTELSGIGRDRAGHCGLDAVRINYAHIP